MPEAVEASKHGELLAEVGKHPAGVSMGDLEAAFPAMQRRTLQRWLASLVAAGVVQAIGKARARRYRRSPDATAQAALAVKPDISLSVESKEIARAVGAPRMARRPVGYRRDFLDRYRPNGTFYLPETLREHLRQIGRTPDGERPAGTFARELLGRLLIDLSWNSSRLEGNTYSLLETRRLIELGQIAEGKDAREAQMILNHKAALEYLVEAAEEARFDRRTILNLHALLSDNLLPDPGASGRVRTVAVGVGGTVFEPLAVPQLVDECFRQLLGLADQIADPFEQAFFVLVQIPYLQPFEDVNKRVSRLAANIPFIRENLCPLSFVDVPEDAYVDGLLGIYELNRPELLRDVFVWAYERSCARYVAVRQALGEPDPFKLRYREQIRDVIAEVVREKLDRNRAANHVREYAGTHVEERDRVRFKAAVEVELDGLHEGNFARFKVRPSEFESWSENWRLS